LPTTIRYVQVRVDPEQKQRLDAVQRKSGLSLQQFLEQLLDSGLHHAERYQNKGEIDWNQLAGDEQELAVLIVDIYRKNKRNDLEEAAIRILQGLRDLRAREESQAKRESAPPSATGKRRS
jgi:hypothetical protein